MVDRPDFEEPIPEVDPDDEVVPVEDDPPFDEEEFPTPSKDV